MTEINNNFEIVNMDKKKVATVTLKPKTPIVKWGERTSSKGQQVFFRKWNNKYVNLGRFKNGHVYLSYDNKLVKDHNLKYENDEQLKEDANKVLETLVIIE